MLVVFGRDDEFTPVEEAQALRDGIPGAELAVVARAAHMPNLEQPEVFNRAVLRFRDGLRRVR